MIASILIIAFSIALLVYWFRYSCILLLRNQPDLAPAPFPIADNQFSIQELQERLRTEAQLDPLHAAIRKDFEVVTYLLQHAAGLELHSIEDRLLVLDYKVMQRWYQLTRLAAPEQARQALSEMVQVVAVLSSKIGERASAHSEA